MRQLLSVPVLLSLLLATAGEAQSPEQNPESIEKYLGSLFQQGNESALRTYNLNPDTKFLGEQKAMPLTGTGAATTLRPGNPRLSMDEVLGESTGIDRNALQVLGLRKNYGFEKAPASTTPNLTGRKSAEKYLAEGTIKKMAGDNNGSIEKFKQAVAADPEFPAAYYNLACAYAEKSDAAAAIKYLQKAIAFNPEYRKIATRDSDFDIIRHQQSFRDALR